MSETCCTVQSATNRRQKNGQWREEGAWLGGVLGLERKQIEIRRSTLAEHVSRTLGGTRVVESTSKEARKRVGLDCPLGPGYPLWCTLWS